MTIDHYDAEPKGTTVTLSSCRRLTTNGLLFHVELGFAKERLERLTPWRREVKKQKPLGHTTNTRPSYGRNHPKMVL